MDTVSIILINYNSTNDTIECLESIKNAKRDNLSVYAIVVDNNSKDEEKEKLNQYIQNNSFEKCDISNERASSSYIYKNNEYNVIISFGKENYGFSGANNIGLEYANLINSDYFWILNNDTVIDSNAIINLVDFAKKNKDSIIGTTICEYYAKDKIQMTAGFNYSELTSKNKKINQGTKLSDLEKLEIKRLDCVSGCSFFFDKSTFEKIEYLDEDYFLYYEELNLRKKCLKLNIQNLWCKNAIIWHKEGKSIGSKNIVQKKSDTSELYGTVSCLTYFYKHYKLKFLYMYLFRINVRFTINLLHFDFHKIKVLNRGYLLFNKKRKSLKKYR